MISLILEFCYQITKMFGLSEGAVSLHFQQTFEGRNFVCTARNFHSQQASIFLLYLHCWVCHNISKIRAVPSILCLRGQTLSVGANSANLHRDLPYTDRVSSQTLCEKKEIGFPGGGNCPEPAPRPPPPAPCYVWP